MTTDLAALLQAARDDLEDVRSRLDDLYAHLDAREWQPDSARSASGHRSRVLFDPTQLPVRQAWDDVQRELGRADQLLRDHTDVPAAAMLPVVHGERTPLADLRGSQIACVLLDGMLRWCQGETFADEAAVREACEHIGAARARIDDLWPPRDEPRRCKRAGCKRADGRPRPLGERDGDVCATCRKRDQRARDSA